MATVLLVDDDVKLTQLLERYFAADGFGVQIVHDGLAALAVVRTTTPDIIVLDLMLPAMDGWEVCRAVRQETSIPILMLTAREEVTDRLAGLEMGADDYVVKPFSPREVVARCKAILRRSKRSEESKEVLQRGELRMDLKGVRVILADRVIDLTPTEFKILELLMTNPGQVFSRLQMIEQVQGYAFDGFERTIDAHVKNLRKKIEDNPKEPRRIVTVFGVGYKYAGDGDA